MKLYALFMLFLLFCADVFAFEKKDYVTYFGTTDKSITAGWNQVACATSYEVRIFHVEREIYVALGKTPNLKIPFKLPRTGHYIVEIRAVNDNATTEANKFSDWSISIDPATARVDGQPRAWWVYGHVAPPGQIIIN